MTGIFSSVGSLELALLITSADALDLPAERRFDGDDAALCAFMAANGLKQTLVDKLLIKGELMREALHRGLHIPRKN